jgi:hypothetical protein
MQQFSDLRPTNDAADSSKTEAANDRQHDSPADRIAYMADLILELKQMAEASEFRTLATILGLAHVEAKHAAARL